MAIEANMDVIDRRSWNAVAKAQALNSTLRNTVENEKAMAKMGVNLTPEQKQAAMGAVDKARRDLETAVTSFNEAWAATEPIKEGD